MRVLDLFSCLGHHAIGFDRAGDFTTTAFIEANPWRRVRLAADFPGTPIHDDVRTYDGLPGEADIIIGGPPCQSTSVAAAIHGKRSGESMFGDMLRLVHDVGPEWVVVEQPPGNARWEANSARDLAAAGYHTARLEFAAGDLGAPYQRRRVFILASPDLPRLALAWGEAPRAIDRVARAAASRGAWDPAQLALLPLDARSAGEYGRGRSRDRIEEIEALGDSNPPEMAEVVAHCILAAERDSRTLH